MSNNIIRPLTKFCMQNIKSKISGCLLKDGTSGRGIFFTAIISQEQEFRVSLHHSHISQVPQGVKSRDCSDRSVLLPVAGAEELSFGAARVQKASSSGTGETTTRVSRKKRSRSTLP